MNRVFCVAVSLLWFVWLLGTSAAAQDNANSPKDAMLIVVVSTRLVDEFGEHRIQQRSPIHKFEDGRLTTGVTDTDLQIRLKGAPNPERLAFRVELDGSAQINTVTPAGLVTVCSTGRADIAGDSTVELLAERSETSMSTTHHIAVNAHIHPQILLQRRIGSRLVCRIASKQVTAALPRKTAEFEREVTDSVGRGVSQKIESIFQEQIHPLLGNLSQHGLEIRSLATTEDHFIIRASVADGGKAFPLEIAAMSQNGAEVQFFIHRDFFNRAYRRSLETERHTLEQAIAALGVAAAIPDLAIPLTTAANETEFALDDDHVRFRLPLFNEQGKLVATVAGKLHPALTADGAIILQRKEDLLWRTSPEASAEVQQQAARWQEAVERSFPRELTFSTLNAPGALAVAGRHEETAVDLTMRHVGDGEWLAIELARRPRQQADQ